MGTCVASQLAGQWRGRWGTAGGEEGDRVAGAGANGKRPLRLTGHCGDGLGSLALPCNYHQSDLSQRGSRRVEVLATVLDVGSVESSKRKRGPNCCRNGKGQLNCGVAVSSVASS